MNLFFSIKSVFCVFLCLVGACAFDRVAYGEDTGVAVWMDSKSGFAIGGYDPVSYFTRRKAVLGVEDYQHDENDVYWKFENIGNKEAFQRDPHVYRPQFSGYDPYALAKKRTIKGLPTLWVIHKNKLYFFHNIINRRLWEDDRDKYLRQAADDWPKLSKRLLRRIEID